VAHVGYWNVLIVSSTVKFKHRYQVFLVSWNIVTINLTLWTIFAFLMAEKISQYNDRNSSQNILWFQGLLSFIFIIAGDITSLIDFASFLIWIFYGAAMVALMLMRRTKKDVKRPYKVFHLIWGNHLIKIWKQDSLACAVKFHSHDSQRATREVSCN
jgi:amino acid transporter